MRSGRNSSPAWGLAHPRASDAWVRGHLRGPGVAEPRRRFPGGTSLGVPATFARAPWLPAPPRRLFWGAREHSALGHRDAPREQLAGEGAGWRARWVRRWGARAERGLPTLPTPPVRLPRGPFSPVSLVGRPGGFSQPSLARSTGGRWRTSTQTRPRWGDPCPCSTWRAPNLAQGSLGPLGPQAPDGRPGPSVAPCAVPSLDAVFRRCRCAFPAARELRLEPSGGNDVQS